MQPNPPVPHGQKRRGQHQGDAHCHHQPRPWVDIPAAPPHRGICTFVQTQADKANCQHHHHGFHQHFDKFIDGFSDSLGLILNIDQLHAHRKLLGNLRNSRMQSLTQTNDVASLAHGDTQRNHFAAVMPHFDARRIFVAPRDLCDIP